MCVGQCIIVITEE